MTPAGYDDTPEYNLLRAELLIAKAAAMSDPIDPLGGIRRTLDRAKKHLALAFTPEPPEPVRLIADSRPAPRPRRMHATTACLLAAGTNLGATPHREHP